jgi:GNAT superfamily N-acetyltransferase
MSAADPRERDSLEYVVDLARKNYEAIGFIPRPKLEAYWEQGQILVSTENDDPCGFLLYGVGWPTLRVYQACIQYDARRREHGLVLVTRLIRHAERTGHSMISLWCADDLDSNAFWKACGFVFGGQKQGGIRRGRKLNLWTFNVSGALTLLDGDAA